MWRDSPGNTCSLPSATCPTDSTASVHASFAPTTVPKGKSPVCTAVVDGMCDIGYSGRVQAKCCWNPAEQKTTWQPLPTSTGCVKDAVCPAHAEQLHASFPANTSIPESNADCYNAPVTFGQCDAGYAGAPRAKCCWDAFDNMSKWNLVSSTPCIKLALCPSAVDPELHAGFGFKVVVPEQDGRCTPPKQGQCARYWYGSVDARCCWNSSRADGAAYWIQASVNSTLAAAAGTTASAGGCKSIWPVVAGALVAIATVFGVGYKCAHKSCLQCAGKRKGTQSINSIYESLEGQ